MKEQTLAVQRMQDYIEENIEREITMAEFARASLFSPWHSYRLFRSYTGLTPAEYIRRLRLSKSALRLKNEGCRVIDAAYDLGYGSVDGYQRAFYREFGCNPGEYAKSPVPITLFIPYGVKFRELRKDEIDMENVQSVFIQVISKPARRVIVKRGVNAEDYFPYCEEVGCDVCGLLTSMDSLCGEPVCLWLPEKYKKPGTSTYVQGVEVAPDYDSPVPEGLDLIDLPFARSEVDLFLAVKERAPIEDDAALVRRYDARDTAQGHALAGTGSADRRRYFLINYGNQHSRRTILYSQR